jgi:HEAT repeat protein
VARSGSARALPTLDLDLWSQWWRFNGDPYLEVTPWPLGPMTGEGARAERTESGLSSEVVHGTIVPALRAALEEDPSETLRGSVLLSLARIGAGAGDWDLLELLVGHLDHANLAVAETACVGIGLLERPETLEPLSALYLDTEEGRALVGEREVPLRMRAFAAYGLGLVGQHTDDRARHGAAVTLLQGLARKPGAAPDDRVAAVVALGLLGDAPEIASEGATFSHDEVADRLLELLGSRREHLQVRAHLPGSLARLAPHTSPRMRTRLTDALIATASDRGERDPVREGAILALGRLGDADEDPVDERIRRRLSKLAVDGNHRARSFSLLALARIGARAGDGAGDSRAGTVEVARFLTKRLARTKAQDEPWVALALGVLARGQRDRGELPETALTDALREGLAGAKSPDARAAYAIALGLGRDHEAREALQDEVEELDPSTRAFAALALGMTGSPVVIEALHTTLADARHEPGTLVDATRALALLHDPALLEQLEEVSGECDCTLSRQGVSLALGRSRHPGAVLPLLARLGDEDATDVQRAFAAIGLGYLAEEDATPWRARLSVDLNYRASTDTLASATRSGILDLP